MVVRYLLATLVAGLFVGVVMTPVQYAGVIPLILHAEVYEQGGDAGPPEHAAGLVAPAEAAERAAPQGVRPIPVHATAAAPANDEARANANLFASRLIGTLSANIVTGCGFALMLAAVALLAGRRITFANGAFWGLAGFACVALAPALGLPPELPAMPVADLTARQIWWVATALLTAAGLYGLVLRQETVAKIAGIALLFAPHLVAVPRPADLSSPIPPTLAAEFAVASLATGAVFWVLLGLALGALMDRFGSELT
ncbi:CbtA family protein [Jiella sp. MQZ9-1]|uniref:CbtA family protein n=1 Tax=Jiella flava TaxID=2816857 RepID=A0A939FX15_9HYPH|nr:CbtA family protein [Jiella flava]MBO0663548.1 CbtA family protein [Jiella flava]MCD2472123.1 CbtA family protein [Jiella flava]